MLYRVVLLLAVFNGVFAGGAQTERILKFRREESETAEEKRTGGSANVCGKDVTPDFIQSCVYTDCYRSDADAPRAGIPHDGLTRRRLAGWDGPFKFEGGQDSVCTINPTAPNPEGSTALPATGATYNDCADGDSRASWEIYGDTAGKKVCSYTSAWPVGTGAQSALKCQCKTVRCRVITKEDDEVKPYGGSTGVSMYATDIKQKADQKACNFIVRIEASHPVPSVPKWIMWVIFALALVVATVTSAFFICLYGSKTHEPEGGDGEGSNE